MLTDAQKQKLIQLMNNCPHEKLKPILLDAIPKWISGEVKPRKGYYGIFEREGKFQYNGVGSCLIGTTLIGKDTGKVYSEILGIDCISTFDIEDAFDNQGISDTPEMEYVAKISEVIFGCT